MSVKVGRAPALRELQCRLAARIVAPDQAEGGGPGAGELARWLTVPDGIALADRLAVYVDGYPARVQEALEEVFPALAHILGFRTFAALAHRYVAAIRLSSYNLNDAGESLPAFLGSDEVGERLPFAADLAQLEWHLARAFHAVDAPPFDPSVFAAWQLDDWDRAVLRFQPSVAVLRSAWPIRELWEARETPREEIDIDLQDRPDDVLVCRDRLEVRCTSIGRGEAAVLEALLAGSTLGGVTAIVNDAGDDPAAVSQWFAAWVQAGLLAGCSQG